MNVLIELYDSARPAQGDSGMDRKGKWVLKVWASLTHWSGEIEDRGSEDLISVEDAQRALREAQERSERVKSIKAEVRIVSRKYK